MAESPFAHPAMLDLWETVREEVGGDEALTMRLVRIMLDLSWNIPWTVWDKARQSP